MTLSTKSVAWYGNDPCSPRTPSRNSRFCSRLGCHTSIPKSPKFPQYTVATSCSAVILNMSVVLSEYPWNHLGLDSYAPQSISGSISNW